MYCQHALVHRHMFFEKSIPYLHITAAHFGLSVSLEFVVSRSDEIYHLHQHIYNVIQYWNSIFKVAVIQITSLIQCTTLYAGAIHFRTK
jgi:hypothetical protein